MRRDIAASGVTMTPEIQVYKYLLYIIDDEQVHIASGLFVSMLSLVVMTHVL